MDLILAARCLENSPIRDNDRAPFLKNGGVVLIHAPARRARLHLRGAVVMHPVGRPRDPQVRAVPLVVIEGHRRPVAPERCDGCLARRVGEAAGRPGIVGRV